MKVTYNHIAAIYLLELAGKHYQDFYLNDRMMQTGVEDIMSSASVNLKKPNKDSFAKFIQFCLNTGYLYENKGKLMVNRARCMYTYEEYMKEYIPDNVVNPSLTKIGEYTRNFGEDHQLQYLKNMTDHVIGEKVREQGRINIKYNFI
jgi:hypothetical protein